jgi:hypothetical protein
MKNRITIVILSLLLLSAPNLFSQEANNVLKVQGEAIINTTPEILLVNIPIQTKDSVYEECSKQLVNKYNQLKKALVKNGVDEKSIQSNNLSVSENYTWDQRERKFEGYIGNLNVSIEMEYSADKLSSVIETLKDNEFKFGYNISFKLSEKQKSAQLEKAITLAVEDAALKAKIICKAMNIQLGGILEINFGYTTPSNDILMAEGRGMMYKAQGADDSLQLDLNPQTFQIQKSIGIIWKIVQ